METLLVIVIIGIVIFCYKAAKDVPINKNTLISKKKSSDDSLIAGMVLGEIISNNTQENLETKIEQNHEVDLDSCEEFEDFQDL